MSNARIAIVVGTRPEIIKMAPVCRKLSAADKLEYLLISSGQHREMSRQALSVFGLQPDIELDLMTPGQSLAEFASRALVALNDTLAVNPVDAVLVHGDTTTTLMASLAAFYQKKWLGHIEAGMRTGDLRSPWPEEMNRRLTAPLARWHFVPLHRNQVNLLQEGVSPSQCYVTGNTVVDSLHWIREILQSNPPDAKLLRQRLGADERFFENYLSNQTAMWLLVTGHRRESQNGGIANLCDAITRLLNEFPQLGIVFPVHSNPAVNTVVYSRLSGVDRVLLTKPLDYLDFVWLMQRCFAIVTDSGGIQGEALSLGKPVLVTRDVTEYPEAIECGGCELVGMETASICRSVARLIADQTEYCRRASVKNPFGDGHAASRIVEVLTRELIG